MSQISNYQILAPGSSDGGFASLSDPSLAIGKIDVGALRARENEAIAKLREQDANKGKGVTKEAQEIFDWFKRTSVLIQSHEQLCDTLTSHKVYQHAGMVKPLS